MHIANAILEVLYDRRDQFVWQGDLTESAGTDLAGVGRALTTLAQRGHRFEESPIHGVRLLRPTVLDAHLIERSLPVEQIGRHVICFGEVDSTNDVAFDSCRQAGNEAIVVTAEHQRAGRGRFGRTWISPPGANILASVLLARGQTGLAHDALTVAAGLAVAEGIDLAAGTRARLEWPNDVVLEGGKVAGVMVEARAADGGRCVVGFGINVAAKPAVDAVDRPAMCLADVVGGAGLPERVEVLRCVLTRLDEWVAAIRRGDMGALRDRWLSRCAMLNRHITVCHRGSVVSGRVLDVSPLEGLVLQADRGGQLHLEAAATTVLAW